MNFREEVLSKVGLLLSDIGFIVSENFEKIIKFEKDDYCLTFSHDEREDKYTLWVGRSNNEMHIEISKKVLKEFFNVNRQFSNSSTSDFLNDVLLFLNYDGRGIIDLNKKTYIELEDFIEEKSASYTEQLLRTKALSRAAEAWKKKDYKAVISELESKHYESLPKSFQQKLTLSTKYLGNKS